MSHIDDLKMRLSDLFLRDCADLRAETEALIRDDLKTVLQRYFRLDDFSVRFSRTDRGVGIELRAVGRRGVKSGRA